MWEILCTLLEEKRLDLALPPDDEKQFTENIGTEKGYRMMDKMLSSVDVQQAKAYNEADQEMIQAVVTATMGSGAGLLLPPGPNISCTDTHHPATLIHSHT